MTIPVNNSMARILSTPIGSRVCNPNFGSRLCELIDKNATSVRADAARFAHSALVLEPRIVVDRVKVSGEKMQIDYYASDSSGSLELDL